MGHAEASEGSAAQTADDQASAPKTALSKKKLLKKQKKAIIAAAGVGASKEGQLDKQNKQAAADQQQQQQPLPEPAFLHDAVSKKHRKQQKLASKSVGAADATGSVADAVPCAAPVQEGSVQADVSQPNGAEVQQPALKKRRVRFAMKRNLLMQIGGAVPPQEVRTPPGSRPKVNAASILCTNIWTLQCEVSVLVRSCRRHK